MSVGPPGEKTGWAPKVVNRGQRNTKAVSLAQKLVTPVVAQRSRGSYPMSNLGSMAGVAQTKAGSWSRPAASTGGRWRMLVMRL